MKQTSFIPFAIFAVFAVPAFLFQSCGNPKGEGAVHYDLDPELYETRHVEADLSAMMPIPASIGFEQYIFHYTTLGPDMKTPVRLTGSISMPTAVFNKECAPSSLMLYSQYTTAKRGERTSGTEVQDVAFYLNPLQSRIIISADLYGWSNTVDEPQAYCCQQTNALATMDCWDAALMFLEAHGYAIEGLPIYNIGFSAGAFGAMAVQKYVSENRPEMHFAVTAVGGGPFDLATIYRDYLDTDTTGYMAALPMMVVGYKETFDLPFEYSDVFRKPLCDSIDSWILSKKYTTQEICGKIGPEKRVSDVLTPQARNIHEGPGGILYDKFRENSLCGYGQDWKPDTLTRYLVLHSPGDLYITYKSGVNMANYLKSHGCDVITDFNDWGNHIPNEFVAFLTESLALCTPDGDHAWQNFDFERTLKYLLR